MTGISTTFDYARALWIREGLGPELVELLEREWPDEDEPWELPDGSPLTVVSDDGETIIVGDGAGDRVAWDNRRRRWYYYVQDEDES